MTSISSCNDETSGDDYIPTSIVDFEVSIKSPQFFSLQQERGFTFVKNEGDRGIILYRKSVSEITAIESNCSYMSNEACANVSVDESGLFMVDTCCKSTFDFNGIPKSGPARGRLFLYSTSLQDGFLRVNN